MLFLCVDVFSSDLVYHGRGMPSVEFFYIYSWVIRDSYIQLPLDEFCIGVSNALKVALSQLHPNSWAYLRGFQILCSTLRLTATLPIFLHHCCTHLGKNVSWLSLISQSWNHLLDLFTSSYKNFKDGFF